MKMPYLLRAPLTLIGLLALSSGSVAANVPPPAAAYIMKLTTLPQDERIIFAATHGSGFYRSDNAGDSWEDISPGTGLRHFNVAVFDPNHDQRLFTGGRESGLWQSDNQGDAWQNIALPDQTILSLIVHPADSQRLWALTPAGVFRTTTGADGNWRQVFNYPAFIEANDIPWPNPDWAVRMSRFQHLTIDPHQPDTIYLGARWEGGYHVSHDGGETWEHHWIGPIFRRGDRIIPDPVDPDLLWAETHHQGMFKSHNRGQSWVVASHGIAPQKRTPHYGAVLISGSAFHPSDPNTLYAGSDYSNWKTTDAGATWTEVGTSLTCEFARSFLVTSDVIYAGTNVGVYRSYDAGETWTSANRGFPTREILDTARGTVDGKTYEFAVVKGRPAVFRRSIESAGDWVSISWLLYKNASAIRFDETNETVFITTPNGEFGSRDGGLRWDVPPTIFATQPLIAAPPLPPSAGTVSVAIQGAPQPDDSLVDSWYQRPPYISLKVVSPGYPKDGSVPRWRGYRDSRLSDQFEIPAELLHHDTPLMLRAEVRDFQFGTRVGTTPLQADQPNIIEVDL